MKKVLSLILSLVIVLCLLCGCGESYNPYDNAIAHGGSQDGIMGLSNQTYTLTEFLEKSYEREIIFYPVSSIDKDEVPDYVFVFKDGNCICYNNDGIEYSCYENGFNLSLTLGELAQMTDEEILNAYKTAWDDGYYEALSIWSSESKWQSRLASGEAKIFKNQYMPYDICIMTDSTGNNTASETIFLPREGFGKRTYSMMYDHNDYAYSTNCQYGDFNLTYFSELKTTTTVYELKSGNVKGKVYNSNYVGFDLGGGKFITRANVNLTLDDLNTETYTYGVDYDEADLKYVYNKFYTQYKSCFEYADV